MVAYAIGVYQGIKAPVKIHTCQPYPADKINMIDKEKNKKMWMYLENSAIMDFISPFLVFQIKQAEHLGIWPISEIIEDVMKRRKTGEKLVMPYIQTVRCSNIMCTLLIVSKGENAFEMGALCKRCLKQTYCSNRCE